MSKATPPGVGKNLRGNEKVNFDTSVQTPIVNQPFDPINAECAILECFSTWCGPCIRVCFVVACPFWYGVPHSLVKPAVINGEAAR